MAAQKRKLAENSQKTGRKRGAGRPFVKGDPRINRKGAPRSGLSWKELIAQVGEELDEDDPTSTRKEAFVRSLFKRKGDAKAAYALFNQSEPVPNTVNLNVGGPAELSDEQLKAEILAQRAGGRISSEARGA